MFELVYASAARRKFDPQELGHVLERARLNNGRLHVSGILLYDAGSFLQVLEGDEQVVRALLAKISRDERHDRVTIISEKQIANRSFSQWTMGFVSLDPQLSRQFPLRHGLRSDGSLEDEKADVRAFLEGFRDGRYRNYITG